MSRKHEDFDEFCDPDNPRQIKYDDVVNAMNNIKSNVLLTPCIPSHYQREFVMRLYYKLEMVQKTGSFKERGALNALQLLPVDKKKIGVILASNGNTAAGVSYYGSKLGIPVTVVMPINVPISKLQLCHSMGAKVIVQGANLTESQKFARVIARDRGLTFINSRDHPHVLAGYGTLALEILEQVPTVEAIIVPVGMGGLIGAVATVVKHVRPNCLVYGVQSENMPAFFKSLEMGEPTTIPFQHTIADAIGIPTVGVNSFYNAQSKVDKMVTRIHPFSSNDLHQNVGQSILLEVCIFVVAIRELFYWTAHYATQLYTTVTYALHFSGLYLLVNDDWIARAILHLVESERFVVEGAGACPLAAIIGNLVPELKTKTVVCVLSGGNIDTILLCRCMDRGMAAEGRLVKFKVGIKDKPTATAQLLRLLANGGYNVVRQFQDHVWVNDDVFTVEMKLVCETKSLEHALELKRIVERAYPCTSLFETEPFNDKRTCPCYVRRST